MRMPIPHTDSALDRLGLTLHDSSCDGISLALPRLTAPLAPHPSLRRRCRLPARSPHHCRWAWPAGPGASDSNRDCHRILLDINALTAHHYDYLNDKPLDEATMCLYSYINDAAMNGD